MTRFSRFAKLFVLVLQLLHATLERRERFLNLRLRKPWCDVPRAIPVECFNPNYVGSFDHIFTAWFAEPFEPVSSGNAFENLRVAQDL